MKKLALALVCLVSLAFFASCNPEGQPSIAVLQEEGYVADGDVVDVNTEFNFGFVMTSSVMTGKELATLTLTIDDGKPETITLTGTEYTYRGTLMYEVSRDSIIGESTITATVADVNGETATATIVLSINQPDQPLISKAFEWVRRGANVLDAEEMASFGLQWTGTYKAPFATIKPIDGATMYVCDGNDFATITTNTEKAAYFANLAETATAAESYRKIDANASANYNDMLAVVKGENCYLIHISRAKIESITGVGTQITITGETK